MALKKSNLPELKAQIKNNKLKNLYVFYGDEEYLKELYIKRIEALLPDAGLPEFNHIYINGAADYGVYDDAWEAMPFMTDKRLLVIRDSNIFTTRRAGDVVPPGESQKRFWTEKFKRLSDDTVIIFCEKHADAGSALFKAASKAGFAVNFEFQSESDLKAWIIKRTLKAGKRIDDKTAEYLVSVTDPGLSNLEHELDKLLNFCGDVIYRSDVDKVVSKAVLIQIFDITDGIMNGDPDKVFKIITDLRTQKESAFGILYLIYSNVEKMLRLKLANVTGRNEAAQLLGVSPWLAARYLSGANAFDVDALTHMTTRVPETDYEIKCGAITEWQALERYIFEAINMRNKK